MFFFLTGDWLNVTIRPGNERDIKACGCGNTEGRGVVGILSTRGTEGGGRLTVWKRRTICGAEEERRKNCSGGWRCDASNVGGQL